MNKEETGERYGKKPYHSIDSLFGSSNELKLQQIFYTLSFKSQNRFGSFSFEVFHYLIGGRLKFSKIDNCISNNSDFTEEKLL